MKQLPWFNLEEYKKTRLLEAKYEAEIARKLLEENLIRNSAGKAFQAWKALVAAISVDYREKLKALFPGKVKLKGGKKVEKVDWIIAIMPTTLLKRVAQLIGGKIDVYTNLALHLYAYQYNGPDPQGIISPYIDDESAKADILKLLEVIEEIIKEESL